MGYSLEFFVMIELVIMVDPDGTINWSAWLIWSPWVTKGIMVDLFNFGWSWLFMVNNS